MRACRYILVLLMLLVGIGQTYGTGFGIGKVVIDAGHGGKDPGATSGKYKEKDITLKVALKLGRRINTEFPDIEVIYTRKTDIFIPLDQRGQIANKAGADLFISIHVNASKNTAPSGTETFVMGVAKSTQNLEVAMLENSAITFEEDYSSRYEGYDPKSSESFIIFSLMQYGYLNQSLELANLVQSNYVATVGGQNRGVKQAQFLVLWKTAMPSILTEIGFISNASDRALITSDKGQNDITEALFASFSKYKNNLTAKPAILEEAPAPTAKTSNKEKKAEVKTTAPTKENTQSAKKAKQTKHNQHTGGLVMASKRGSTENITGNEEVVRGKKTTMEAEVDENDNETDEPAENSVKQEADAKKTTESTATMPVRISSIDDDSEELSTNGIEKPQPQAEATTAKKTDVGQNLPVRISDTIADEEEIEQDDAPASDNNQQATPVKIEKAAKMDHSDSRNFKVQVLLSVRRIAADSPRFEALGGKIEEIRVGNLYKYYIGNSESYQEALTLRDKIRKTFKNAFIVEFRDGQPLATLQE